MRNKKLATGILAGAMVLGSAMAFADSTEVGKWGVALNSGFSTFAMTDVNDQFSQNGNNGGGGGPSGYSDITSGEQIGLEVKYRLAENWGLGLEANYLIAGNTDNLGVGAQPVGTETVNLGATEYLVNGSYIFPSVATGLDLRVGLGLGFVMLSGATDKFNPNSFAENNFGVTSSTEDLSGGGFDAKVFVGADYYFIPSLSLGLNIGYRYASVSPVTLSGQQLGNNAISGTWQNSSGANQSVDYSGLDTQLALTWWIQ